MVLLVQVEPSLDFSKADESEIIKCQSQSHADRILRSQEASVTVSSCPRTRPSIRRSTKRCCGVCFVRCAKSGESCGGPTGCVLHHDKGSCSQCPEQLTVSAQVDHCHTGATSPKFAAMTELQSIPEEILPRVHECSSRSANILKHQSHNLISPPATQRQRQKRLPIRGTRCVGWPGWVC